MKDYSIKVFNICILLLTLLINIRISKADGCANTTSTQGNEFWIAFLQNHDEELTIPHGLDLIISVEKATNVHIINEATGYHWFEDFKANSVQSFTVPCQLFNTLEYGEPVDRALHITSTEPISVYMNNHQNNSSDATLSLPVSACGSYYIIQNAESCKDSHYKTFQPSVFSIIAFEDDTKVQITPTLKTSNGEKANQPFIITLKKGFVYQVASTIDDEGKSLSGSQVLALNGKKIAVFAGNKSANVPYSAKEGNSNILFEVCQPVSSWGKNFIIRPFYSGLIDMIKCTACVDGTKIYKNGKLLKVINAFESYEFFAKESDGHFKLETSEPVCVNQYMTSNNYSTKRANGGPSMLYVNPVEQAINKIVMCTPPHDLLKNHFINLVIKSCDASKIKFDGKTKFAKFTPIDDTYSTGYVIVGNGQHTLESPNGFIANAYGMGDGITYAYCAGSNVYDLNTKSNTEATICKGDSYTYKGKKYTETGFYIDTLKNSNGCDSLAFLNLKVLPYDTVHYYDTITIGDSYIKNGFKYEKPNIGVYDEIIGECPHFSHLELVVEHEPCLEGTLIFREDFGGNSVSDPAISRQAIPECTYEFNADPRDQYLKGRYSVRKESYKDKDWANIIDHTYPDNKDKGYFMQCDAANVEGKAPGVLYAVQINDICEKTPFYFTFWGMSMIKKGADSTYANACLKLVVEDLEGNVLRTKKINMPNGKEEWTLYGLPYELPAGVTSAVFKILNNSTSNYGNDFAIDDIEIHVCKPAVEIKVNENSPCENSKLSLLAEDYKNDSLVTPPAVYEWYYSKSNDIQSSDWTLVGKEKKFEIAKLTKKDNGYYRVFVGNKGAKEINNNCSPASDMIKVEVKKCEAPVCHSDTVKISTCLAVDTLIDILKNDIITDSVNSKLSLIKAPVYAKINDNKLSYKLIDSKIKTDTIRYSVSLGSLADTASVIFMIDHPSMIKRIDTLICSGSKYNNLVLFEDTIVSDTSIIKENGCPSIVNHVVSVLDIVANLNDTALCIGDTTTLTVKNQNEYDYKYEWFDDSSHKKVIGNKKSFSVKAKEETSYYVVVSAKSCKKEVEATLKVYSKPYLDRVVEINKNDLEIIADGGSSVYEFMIDKKWTTNNIIKNYIGNKNYEIQIKDDNGCITDTTFQTPSLNLIIPTLITPNGDGHNDYFSIKNLDLYPNATVQIFERHGKILLDCKASEFINWDGRINGHRMHSEDYWYIIDVKEHNKVYKGHFSIIWDD